MSGEAVGARPNDASSVGPPEDSAAAAPHWPAHLDLSYRRSAIEGRTVLRDRHTGPLRVLRSLYPEGPSICHTVLVHPPGGIVGGDRLEVDIDVGPGAHALLTTPGATRYYRSDGAVARQSLSARVAPGGRLESLPGETLVHRGAIAENRMRFALDAGAEMIGWDVLALGLPASGEPFDRGRILQCIELPGLWVERGAIDGHDALLLDSPLGWAGRRVLATAWFAAGTPLTAARRGALITVARAAVVADAALSAHGGVTSPDARLIVLRILAPNVEAAMHLSRMVWRAWRVTAWSAGAAAPRLWST